MIMSTGPRSGDKDLDRIPYIHQAHSLQKETRGTVSDEPQSTTPMRLLQSPRGAKRLALSSFITKCGDDQLYQDHDHNHNHMLLSS